MTGPDKLHVLLTRDLRASERTAVALGERGFGVLVLPLFEIEDTGAAFNPPQNADVLFSSANAPLTLAQRGWRAGTGSRAWCVGSRTAEAVAKLGFAQVRHASGGGAALADLAAEHVSSKDDRLWYGAAEVRSFDLKAALEKRGFQVVQRELYRTVETFPGKLEAEAALKRADYALIFSAASVKRLIELAETHGLRSRFAQIIAICISSNVADLLAKADWAAITIASHPCEQAMLNCISGQALVKPEPR